MSLTTRPQLATARRVPPKTVRLDDGRFVMMQLREGRPGSPQIVCFPFAGGGPLAFKAFAEHLPREYSVWAIDFPGHVRTQGNAHETISAMVADCLRLMPIGLLTSSFFVGYSLGGYVAHALTVELERMGHTVPGVIIAGSTPTTIRDLSSPLSALDDAGLLEWLQGVGQVDNSPLQLELFELFKPTMRADIKAYDSYRPFDAISAPTLVLGGSHDPMCAPSEFDEWADLANDYRIEIVPGGHFFINTAPMVMADAITGFLDELTRPDVGATGEVPVPSGIRDLAGVRDDDEPARGKLRLIA